MNKPLSPLMEKSNIKKRKKRKFLRFVLSILIFAAVILSAYFVFDYFDIASAQEMALSSNDALAITPTPEVAINTLVPTDYAAILSQTEEPESPENLDDIKVQQTPYVTPEPTVHPGVRDDVFTDGEVISDDMSYRSKDLSVEINVVEKDGHVIYVAEVYFASLDNFMPVFANEKFDGGYATTSDMAEEHDAIFAVNSDSCSVVDYGIIIRNKEVYREIVAADHLAIFDDGSLETFYPRNISVEEFLKDGAVHVFNFGPKLLYEGHAIEAFLYSHIRKANPRTAIGMVEPYHYYFVVVDGRSDYSKGMTMEELSAFMAELGCVDAYNLDGGGSSTMVLLGELVNKPEGGSSERDIDGAILFVEGD